MNTLTAPAALAPDQALDARIAAAFAEDAKSIDVRRLVAEIEAPVKAADVAAQEARRLALDPRLSGDDVKAARRALDDANFTRDRLHEAGTKLAERVEALKALEAERLLWAQHERLTGERARLAKEMESFADAIVQIAHIASQAAACDSEIGRLNAKARGIVPYITLVLSGSSPPIKALFTDGLFWDTWGAIARKWSPSPKPEAATKG